MKEIKEPSKNQIYYRKNKEHYKKGGKYYTYKPKDTSLTGLIKTEKGVFVLNFS